MSAPSTKPKAIDEISARQRAMVHTAVERQAIREGAVALSLHGPEEAARVLGTFVGAWESSLPLQKGTQ